MKTITITPEIFGALKKHGEDSFPNECCGFLYGVEEEDHRVITRYLPADNSKEGDQRRRFEITPIQYMQAERFAEENNLDFLGIFHTHPNHPAIASKWDLEKALPFFSYVISSVRDGATDEIKSWRLYDEKRAFYEESVKIIEKEIIFSKQQ